MSKHLFKGKTVAIEVISDSDRLNFLPAHFGRDYALAESAIYVLADNLIEGYKGGYWEYAEIVLPKGKRYPFFFLRTQQEKLTLCNPFSGDEVEVDSILAGMIVTIYACNFLESERGYQVSGVLTAVAYDYAEETGQGDAAFDMLD